MTERTSSVVDDAAVPFVLEASVALLGVEVVVLEAESSTFVSMVLVCNSRMWARVQQRKRQLEREQGRNVLEHEGEAVRSPVGKCIGWCMMFWKQSMHHP